MRGVRGVGSMKVHHPRRRPFIYSTRSELSGEEVEVMMSR